MIARIIRSVGRFTGALGYGWTWLMGLAGVAAAQGPGSGTTIISGRSLTLEWIITIVMCGLALYLVCRSSNRN